MPRPSANPEIDRSRRSKLRAERPLRIHLEPFLGAAGILTIVAILLSPMPAVAPTASLTQVGAVRELSSSPILAFHPPFVGPNVSSYNVTFSTSNCPGVGKVTRASTVNTTTGRFSFLGHASVGLGTGSCYGQGVVDGGWSVGSPIFVSPVSGDHVLRSYWWLHFSVGLATHYAGGFPGPYPEHAEVMIIISVNLLDLSPFGSSTFATARIDSLISGNESYNFTLNSAVSLPVEVLLTKGHSYQIFAGLTCQLSAYALVSGKNSASARLDIGASGRPAIFEGFGIR
jgi:hypothetical protein